jgi:hypothetical protein
MTRIHAGINTANAVSPMHEVMNHAHAVSGRRIRLMPLTRRSSVVVMKFNEPSNWPTQNSPMEAAQSTTPKPWPGPPTEPTALSGAYCVQPPSVGPSPEERRHQDQESRERDPERHHVEAREGHVFGAHLDGQKEIAEGRKGRGREHKKTMIVPCMVINCR